MSHSMVHPPHERTQNHKYGHHTNCAVSLERVLTIEKAREAYYPDNEGIPTIKFWFGGKDYHQWYFDKGDDSARDRVYREVTAKRT